MSRGAAAKRPLSAFARRSSRGQKQPRARSWMDPFVLEEFSTSPGVAPGTPGLVHVGTPISCRPMRQPRFHREAIHSKISPPTRAGVAAIAAKNGTRASRTGPALRP